MKLFTSRLALVINLSIIMGICICVLIYATSVENSTLVRNSFLVESASVADFGLRPSETPESFLSETLPPPQYLVDVVDILIPAEERTTTTPFEQAQLIASHLIENKTKGKPTQSTTRKAYVRIREQGLGYCADYSQVFVALAHAIDLPVREWGLGFDDFGSGHAFNEIYDKGLEKWVFVDSYHSLYVVDKSTNIPLSALEFQRSLLNDEKIRMIQILPIVSERFRFKTQEKALDYYRKGAGHFYLFWGNNVFSYDQSTPVMFFSSISRALEIMSAILTGVHPAIRVLENTENTNELEALDDLQLYLWMTLSLVSGLVGLAVVQMLKIRNDIHTAN